MKEWLMQEKSEEEDFNDANNELALLTKNFKKFLKKMCGSSKSSSTYSKNFQR